MNNRTPPSRFRFGIRTALMLVTLLAVVLGYLAHVRHRRAAAVAALKEMGCKVSWTSEPGVEANRVGADWRPQGSSFDPVGWIGGTEPGEAIVMLHVDDAPAALAHLNELPAVNTVVVEIDLDNPKHPKRFQQFVADFAQTWPDATCMVFHEEL